MGRAGGHRLRGRSGPVRGILRGRPDAAGRPAARRGRSECRGVLPAHGGEAHRRGGVRGRGGQTPAHPAARPPPARDLTRRRSLRDDDALEALFGAGVARVEVIEHLAQDVGDREVAEPLPVGGDEVPGSPVGGCPTQDLLEGRDVGRPQVALSQVTLRELPALVGLVEPRLEPLALLVAVDVQEELDDGGALVDEHPLPLVDVSIASAPGRPGHQVVDPHHEHVLVVAPVEDRDMAGGRRPEVDAPQVVVRALAVTGDLEAHHAASLGVERVHDMADRAVLARGVDALEDDQHLVPALRPQPLLELGEMELMVRLLGGRTLLVPAVRDTSVERVEVHLGARHDAQQVAQPTRAPLGHRVTPPLQRDVASRRWAG